MIDRHFLVGLVTVLAMIVLIFSCHAQARDLGQWDQNAPTAQWFKNLKQPDLPNESCCGPADAYYADSFEQDKGQYVAIVTDERPDEPLKRPHVAIGTRILIPNNKIKWNEGNPTGHGIVFMSPHPYFYVYCYVPPGGV